MVSTIDEILFPVLLFIFYFTLATQFRFLPTEARTIKASSTIGKPVTLVQPVTNDEQIAVRDSIDSGDFQSPVVSREWLKTQSLANLKAIASESFITVTGDKRLKASWVDAISLTTPENTVLAVNICYA